MLRCLRNRHRKCLQRIPTHHDPASNSSLREMQQRHHYNLSNGDLLYDISTVLWRFGYSDRQCMQWFTKDYHSTPRREVCELYDDWVSYHFGYCCGHQN
ncbi:hypothetical protein ABW19_dt0200841 [Dactylella cylindrospora]|nr:hypothetical protein ABW19_dt0200841 [Dactylella cylindrospora]